MKFLLDTSTDKVRQKIEQYPSLVSGQLLTPLTRYKEWGGAFAVDNGAYTKLDPGGFRSLLDAVSDVRSRCQFVAAPDVVGDARRTLELFDAWYPLLCQFKVALVAQDGIESLPIPWKFLDAIFIGGTTDWKDSKHGVNIAKAGIGHGVHVHVGRVNTIVRYRKFENIAHTCDGSGVSRFDHMLEDILRGKNDEQEEMF